MSGGISAASIAAYAAIASAAVGAVSAIQAGQQARSQANQQADAAELNAKLSENQATQAFAAGVNRESAQRRSAAQTLGEQRAAFGASGVDANSGSALDVQLQSSRNAELDALQTRYEGILTGQNYQQQAAMGMYQGDVLRASGRNAQNNSYMTAAGNLLSGAAGAYRTGRSMSNPAPVVERSTYVGSLG
jgi:hypothetical protein